MSEISNPHAHEGAVEALLDEFVEICWIERFGASLEQHLHEAYWHEFLADLVVIRLAQEQERPMESGWDDPDVITVEVVDFVDTVWLLSFATTISYLLKPVGAQIYHRLMDYMDAHRAGTLDEYLYPPDWCLSPDD